MADKDSDSKKKRPSFSAPTPPDEDKELVQNSDEEIIENDPVKEAAAEPTKPTPPSKVITKDGPDKEASFDQMLKGDSTDEDAELVDEDDDEIEIVELEDDVSADMEDDSLDSPDQPKKKAGSKSIFKTLIIILLIILGFAGWFLFITTKYPDMLSGSVSLPGSSPSPTPTETPQEPTPTPIDKSTISIEVLNGAGISGAAGETADILEGMGYTIASTGNADSSDYDTTEIYITSDFPEDLLDTFLDDLDDEFGSASISGEVDELDGDANTQIILGTNWFETEPAQ